MRLCFKLCRPGRADAHTHTQRSAWRPLQRGWNRCLSPQEPPGTAPRGWRAPPPAPPTPKAAPGPGEGRGGRQRPGAARRPARPSPAEHAQSPPRRPGRGAERSGAEWGARRRPALKGKGRSPSQGRPAARGCRAGRAALRPRERDPQSQRGALEESALL